MYDRLLIVNLVQKLIEDWTGQVQSQFEIQMPYTSIMKSTLKVHYPRLIILFI